MTDHPIIFSAPMIRALLDGRKTMTRRYAWCVPPLAQMQRGEDQRPSPWQRVKPGDRLWVREAFHATEGFSKPVKGDYAHLFGYEVPGEHREFAVPGIGRVREFSHHLGGWGGRVSKNMPSIHMPRWASRLTLIVTATKIERLQEISAHDAEAEGVFRHVAEHSLNKVFRDERGPTAIAYFRELWENLHGAGSWAANPEVVAISFKCDPRNIDAVKEAA